jgi:hypothetical protein
MQSLIEKNYTSFLDYKIITAVLNIRREYDTKRRQSWRLRPPRMWRCITGCAVPRVMKATCSFKMPGSTHPTQKHTPDDLAQQHCCDRVKPQLNLHDWTCIPEVKNFDTFCYQDFRKCMLAMLEGNMAVRVTVQKTNFWIKYYYIFHSSNPTYPEKTSACFPNVKS